MECDLEIGDIVYDIESKEFGILLERSNQPPNEDLGEIYVVWAWKIYWTNGTCHYYTEGGLFRIVDSERFLIFRSRS